MATKKTVAAPLVVSGRAMLFPRAKLSRHDFLNKDDDVLRVAVSIQYQLPGQTGTEHESVYHVPVEAAAIVDLISCPVIRSFNPHSSTVYYALKYTKTGGVKAGKRTILTKAQAAELLEAVDDDDDYGKDD